LSLLLECTWSGPVRARPSPSGPPLHSYTPLSWVTASGSGYSSCGTCAVPFLQQLPRFFCSPTPRGAAVARRRRNCADSPQCGRRASRRRRRRRGAARLHAHLCNRPSRLHWPGRCRGVDQAGRHAAAGDVAPAAGDAAPAGCLPVSSACVPDQSPRAYIVGRRRHRFTPPRACHRHGPSSLRTSGGRAFEAAADGGRVLARACPTARNFIKPPRARATVTWLQCQ
jgi:hypothetical protein